MKRSTIWCLVVLVLLVLITAVLLAVLLPRSEDPSPSRLRYPSATVNANGYECAGIGSFINLLLPVCMVGYQVGGGAKYGGLSVAILELAMSVAAHEASDEDEYSNGEESSDLERYPNGVVASNGYECASIGREILQKNGSAVDAAIATLFCEGVSCAQCMGLGGGFLATIYDAGTKRVRVLNSRERAPAATTQDMFVNASTRAGGLAAAVPAELRGYGAMYREYGRLPWRELVLPTAKLCREGYRVNSYMARALVVNENVMKTEPSLRELYVNNATGEVWREGDYLVDPAMAATLETIAEEGPEAIHNGSLTSRFVRDIQQFGGIITEEDLRNYRVEWQEPIVAQLNDDLTLYTNPLPGSGSVLAFIMNMLRGWVGEADAPTDSILYWHRIVETFKYAYAKRTGLGDPDRTNIPYDIYELERNLTDPAWAESFRSLVDDTRTFNDWQHYGAIYEGADDHGTAHALVVAPDGSVVSVTSTVNYQFGCLRRSQSTGIILNNEMDDFAIPDTTSVYGLPASPANMLAPGLQPLSSMVPSIVLDRQGRAVMISGAAGGTKITTQIAILLRSVLLEKLDLEYAMARPRIHHQLVPMEVQVEEDFDSAVVLLGLAVGALVAALVLRPWDSAPVHQRFPRAAVGANGYECAEIGRTILEKNGSAVDAAIATLFCEGVSCAQCMGLSGGFLATLYDAASGKVRVLNARERAPSGASLEMFRNVSASVGGLAVAVPGELRGYGAMYRAYGRLPWRDLVMPTIKLCRNGYMVNSYMARSLKTHEDAIKEEPSMRDLYVNEETGDVWHEGNIIVDPALAATLEIIAEEGPEAIHNGSLTSPLVRDIQKFGGIITEEDFRNYRIEWQEPITAQLNDEFTLYTNPLPGSGSVLVFIMNMLRGWVGGGAAPPNSHLYWHRIVETLKYAYAKRTGLGDPLHSNLPYKITDLERNLSNPTWAESFRQLVDDGQTVNDYHHYGAIYEGAEDHGTGHALVIAPDGSVVSITSTLNYLWGCQRRSLSTGILLNNEMDDFAIPNLQSGYGLPPSPANMLAPDLNPLSSMVPSIVLDRKGKVVMVTGAAGGTKITTQIALLLRHVLLERQELPFAMARPRLHHQLLPMEIQIESDFDAAIIEGLEAKGHVIKKVNPRAGFAAIISAARDQDGFLVPHTDIRRPGSIDGL